MRILLITDLYPIMNGNEPITIKEFAKKWVDLGHQVDVIRPNFIFNTIIRNRKLYPCKNFFEDDINIYNVNYFSPFLFNVKNKLPKDFQIGNYNLVISHMPSGTLFAMKLLGKCAGIPFVAAVHASDITVLTKPVYKFYFAKKLLQAYKRADAIAARNCSLANNIKEISPYAVNKTFVAPSGIAPEIIESMEYFEQKAAVKNEPYQICTVAKLIKRKNIDIIIKALHKSKLDNYVFRIIGDGPELDNLKNLVTELNMHEKVIFEGNIPNNDVLIKLRLSDLFILVSTGETFGMAYLEAGARGNIVVATKNDGIDGFLKDNINGFTCEPVVDNLADLIDKIYNLPNDEIRRIILTLRKDLFLNDSVAVSKKYIEKITEIININ